jgi:hypothetical protein
MRQEVTRTLDRIDALRPGSGLLEAFVFADGTLQGGKIGGAIDYSQRVSDSLSAFANASMGYRYGDSSGIEYRGLIGARYTFRGH